ncbi:MAG: sigma 54-interacting transcriptional regulator [Firmicutes bacterium]|jgi:PAS domain S-box-containing protein|nr:sigma 54-interacting transcriptional regulator [Bacillota bacterium]NBI64882.1 PAS domain-containing protein [Clostridiales bacterium]
MAYFFQPIAVQMGIHYNDFIVVKRGVIMENNLFKNDNFIISVLENSYDGIYITNKDGLTLYVNRAYEKLAGHSRSVYVGKYMSDLMAAGLMKTYITKDVVSTGQSITVNETLVSGKDVLITGNPVFDDNGQVITVVTNVRDMSEIFALRRKQQLSEQILSLYHKQYNASELDDIVCESPSTIAVFNIAQKVASKDSTVLLTGETGVGKEIVAKYIHYNSSRKENSYIKINCGAIPENLLESELFGYVGGAFTGANPNGKLGVFEMANEGTLFLDEIGELPLGLQSSLLRVLQDGEVTRIGDTESRKVDVRIIAATNRILPDMLKAGSFREDLYYRLNVISIHIPPLRERREDIPALTEMFIEKLNKRYGYNRKASNSFLLELMTMNWPGNIRELFNFIERQFVITETDTLSSVSYSNIAGSPDGSNSLLSAEDRNVFHLNKVVAAIEASLIKTSLKKYKTTKEAAEFLGISQPTFSRKYNKYKNMGLL